MLGGLWGEKDEGRKKGAHATSSDLHSMHRCLRSIDRPTHTHLLSIHPSPSTHSGPDGGARWERCSGSNVAVLNTVVPVG